MVRDLKSNCSILNLTGLKNLGLLEHVLSRLNNEGISNVNLIKEIKIQQIIG